MQHRTGKTRKAICALLSVVGIGFSLAALLSPAWEVVHLREFQTEHEHGLWLDCARTVKMALSLSGDDHFLIYGESHCTYKFDYSSNEQANIDIVLDENTPDAENVNHRRYKPHQVAYLFLIGTSLICGVAAFLTAICAFCTSTRTLALFSFLSFISGLLSFAVVVSYFFISHSSENRFVKGIIGTYETNNGQAFYFELSSTACYLLALLTGMTASKCSIQSLGTHDANNSKPIKIGSIKKQNLLNTISPYSFEDKRTDKVLNFSIEPFSVDFGGFTQNQVIKKVDDKQGSCDAVNWKLIRGLETVV